MSRHKIILLSAGISMVIVGGLVAALLSNGSGGAHKNALGAANQPASNRSPGTSGAAVGSAAGGAGPKGTSRVQGEVISPAQLAEQGGALSPPKNLQSQIISWQSGPGGTYLAAVSSGFGDALQAAGVRQYAPMKHACAQLATSVTSAQAGPRIPDAAMQELYAKALADLAKGAADCQAAVSVAANGDEAVNVHLDARLLQLSTSELSAGATDIFRSTAVIEILARQRH
jgi:hypothetical protein